MVISIGKCMEMMNFQIFQNRKKNNNNDISVQSKHKNGNETVVNGSKSCIYNIYLMFFINSPKSQVK